MRTRTKNNEVSVNTRLLDTDELRAYLGRNNANE